MSRKRRNTSSAEPDSPPSKIRLSSGYEDDGIVPENNRPQVDALTGLSAAFPGLAGNDEQFYGPARDGLDYLRMVRTEAHRIPSLLRVPDSHYDSHEELQDEDHSGFFDLDEAVIAPPIQTRSEALRMGRAQQLYYRSLMEQFDLVRSEIQSTPALSNIKALSASTPISFPPLSKTARQTWETYITTNAAHPVQIACMEVDSVFELIRLITRKMRKLLQSTCEEDIRRIGMWMWALLAKCPERGQLGGEEIADLRACARAAETTWDWVQSRKSGVAEDDSAEDEDEDEETQGVRNVDYGKPSRGSEVQFGTAETTSGTLSGQDLTRAIETPGLEGQHVVMQHVMLDMIITIVGEAYGQRDLLELRRPWTAGVAG